MRKKNFWSREHMAMRILLVEDRIDRLERKRGKK